MRIMGIDPGSKLGFCYLSYIPDNNSLSYIHSSNIDFKKFEYPEKIKRIRDQIGCEIILSNPDIIVMEDVLSNSNYPSAITMVRLSQICGAIEEACFFANKELILIHSSTVKANVLSGKSKKPEVRDKINEIFNLNIKSEDETDSIAVAYSYVVKLINGENNGKRKTTNKKTTT